MATWHSELIVASKVRVAMPGGPDIDAVVTSITANYLNSGVADASVEWRSSDGQYHGISHVSAKDMVGKELLILQPDSVFKEYNQPFDKPFYGKYTSGSSGPNPFGSQPKPEVTADLSQIEADLAKLPPAPVAAPLASLGYTKGVSPMTMAKEALDSLAAAKEALDSLAAASEMSVAQLKEFEAAKNKVGSPGNFTIYGKPIAEVSGSKLTDKGLELEFKMNPNISADDFAANWIGKFKPVPLDPPLDPFLEIVKHAAQGVEKELFHATAFLVPPPKPNTYSTQHQLSLPNGVMLGVQLTVVVKDPPVKKEDPV